MVEHPSKDPQPTAARAWPKAGRGGPANVALTSAKVPRSDRTVPRFRRRSIGRFGDPERPNAKQLAQALEVSVVMQHIDPGALRRHRDRQVG
jgi:hypothetical protein